VHEQHCNIDVSKILYQCVVVRGDDPVLCRRSITLYIYGISISMLNIILRGIDWSWIFLKLQYKSWPRSCHGFMRMVEGQYVVLKYRGFKFPIAKAWVSVEYYYHAVELSVYLLLAVDSKV